MRGIAQRTVGPLNLTDAAVELLADPKKLDRTLKSLQDAQDRAQKSIDLAGPAQEIIAIRAEVAILKEQAVDAKGQALLDAENIVEEGKIQAQLIVDKATQEAGRTISDANSVAGDAELKLSQASNQVAAVEHKLVQRGAELKKVEEGLTERAAALDTIEAALNVRDAELTKLNDSLLQEKTRLTGISEQLTAALG